MSTDDSTSTAENAHGMIAGSHERPSGAQCRCGADWSRWDGVCAATAPWSILSEEGRAQRRAENTWRIVAASEDQPWPCTIVDSRGRSLLGVHDGTPIIRDRDLAERVLAALNTPPGPVTS